MANATKDEYDNCAKTAKVLTSTSQTLIDLKTSGPQYFICTIDDHCQSGQKLAINVTGGTNPTTTTTPQSPPPPPPSSASALTVGTLFAIVSSTIVMALLTCVSILYPVVLRISLVKLGLAVVQLGLLCYDTHYEHYDYFDCWFFSGCNFCRQLIRRYKKIYKKEHIFTNKTFVRKDLVH